MRYCFASRNMQGVPILKFISDSRNVVDILVYHALVIVPNWYFVTLPIVDKNNKRNIIEKVENENLPKKKVKGFSQ